MAAAIEGSGYSPRRCLLRLGRVMPEIMTRDAIEGTRAALTRLAAAPAEAA